jgi:hypothetical protein
VEKHARTLSQTPTEEVREEKAVNVEGIGEANTINESGQPPSSASTTCTCTHTHTHTHTHMYTTRTRTRTHLEWVVVDVHTVSAVSRCSGAWDSNVFIRRRKVVSMRRNTAVSRWTTRDFNLSRHSRLLGSKHTYTTGTLVSRHPHSHTGHT